MVRPNKKTHTCDDCLYEKRVPHPEIWTKKRNGTYLIKRFIHGLRFSDRSRFGPLPRNGLDRETGLLPRSLCRLRRRNERDPRQRSRARPAPNPDRSGRARRARPSLLRLRRLDEGDEVFILPRHELDPPLELVLVGVFLVAKRTLDCALSAR